MIAVGSIHGFLLYFFYDGPDPPATGVFADILKIPSLKDQTKTRKYSNLLRSAGKGALVMGGRYSFRVSKSFIDLHLPYCRLATYRHPPVVTTH